MPPSIASKITHHTLWQAVTGTLPPLALPAAIVSPPRPWTVRDGRRRSLYRISRLETDGHLFVGQALRNGAQAVLCEERGLDQAAEAAPSSWTAATTGADADPRPDVWRDAMHRLSRWQAARLHRRRHHIRTAGRWRLPARPPCQPDLRVVGITGSVGKTSTKELTAPSSPNAGERSTTRATSTATGPAAHTLGTRPIYEYAVLEMAMYDVGEIATLCRLARPESASSQTSAQSTSAAWAQSSASPRPRRSSSVPCPTPTRRHRHPQLGRRARPPYGTR